MSSTLRNRFFIDDTITRLKAGEITASMIKLWYLVQELDPDPSGEDCYWLVNAIYHLGVAFDQNRIPSKATKIFLDCVARFGDVEDQETAALVDMAAIGAGISASRDSHYVEAIQYLDNAVERLQNATGIADRRALVDALVNRAAVIRKLGAIEKTVAAYDLVFERFKTDDDPVICRNLALVLDEKSKALNEATLDERADRAVHFFIRSFEATWDQIIIERLKDAILRLPDHKRPDYRDRVAREPRQSRRARCLVDIATEQMQQNDVRRSLTNFAAAIDLLDNATGKEDLFWLAQAIHNRGIVLQNAGRNIDAINVFEELYERFKWVPEDGIRRLVDSALVNAAVVAGGTQQIQQALKYSAIVMERLQGATKMEDRRTLAHAMYNKATIFRYAGQIEEAVQAFEATCDRFTEDLDPKVYRFVGMSYFNKSTALDEANLIDRAKLAFEMMAEKFGNATDPFVRERAARAIFALAGNSLKDGDTLEYQNILATLVAMYGGDPEPGIQKIIGQALLAFPPVILQLPPANHELTSPYNRQLPVTLFNEIRNSPEQLEQQLFRLKESMASASEVNANQHAKAIAIVEVYWVEQKPFVLFLRNFDRESSNFALPMGLEFPLRFSYIFPGFFEVEKQIKAAVGEQIPIISIANPSPTIARDTDIPKLEVNNDLWESALQVLIHSAGMIIMMLDKITPGVTRELQAISNLHREDATVLIVSPQVESELPFDVDQRLFHEDNFAQSDQPETQQFALIISSSELPASDGEPLPAMQKLVDHLLFASGYDGQ